jgi:hypothetical protein
MSQPANSELRLEMLGQDVQGAAQTAADRDLGKSGTAVTD